MMKYLLITLLITSSTVCNQAGTYSGGAAGTSDNKESKASSAGFSCNLDIKNMQPNSLLKLGYNMDNLFHTANVENTSFLNLVKQLNPELLRFPGGSLSNYYHPQGKGYGMRLDEINLKDSKIRDNVTRLTQLNNKIPEGPNYLDAYIKLLKTVHAQVLYVVNITSGNTTEALEVITKLRSEGIRIRGVSLGNELYLGTYKTVVPDIESFIQLAKPFAAAIRQQYPDIPIGVPAESQGILRESFNSKWNNRLSEESFYDAAEIHVYPDESDCSDNTLNGFFDCANQKLTDYAENILPTRLNAFSQQFNGKKLWITEWNLKKPGQALGGTLLQSLYAAKFFLTCNNYNSGNNQLEMLTFHNLCADEAGYSLINPDGNAFSANTAFYSMRLFAPLATATWKYKDLSKDGITCASFYNDNTGKMYLYFINTSATAIPLSNINISQKGEKKNYTDISSICLSGKSLYATIQKAGYLSNMDGFNDKSEVMSKYTTLSTGQEKDGMPSDLPAYSLTRISLNIK